MTGRTGEGFSYEEEVQPFCIYIYIFSEMVTSTRMSVFYYVINYFILFKSPFLMKSLLYMAALEETTTWWKVYEAA